MFKGTLPSKPSQVSKFSNPGRGREKKAISFVDCKRKRAKSGCFAKIEPPNCTMHTSIQIKEIVLVVPWRFAPLHSNQRLKTSLFIHIDVCIPAGGELGCPGRRGRPATSSVVQQSAHKSKGTVTNKTAARRQQESWAAHRSLPPPKKLHQKGTTKATNSQVLNSCYQSSLIRSRIKAVKIVAQGISTAPQYCRGRNDASGKRLAQ